MLRFLSIRNFAIIEQVELAFDAGFTVITGETGAGKSILIDALGLLLGDRATGVGSPDDAPPADLSAEFDISGQKAARAWLEENAMDDEDQLVLRRVLPAQGASRAWINGRSATMGQLADLGNLLVEIHGQHEHQSLSRPERQRSLVDQWVDPDAIAAVVKAYARWQSARASLDAFEHDCGDPAQLELLQFQFAELEKLNLQAGEYEGLEQQQERLARSDEIRLCLQQAAAALDHEEGASVRQLLAQAEQALEQVKALDHRFESVCQLIREAAINVDEAAAELERASPDEEQDPHELDAINRRLERCLDLARKHRIRPDELPELTQKLSERLDTLAHQDERRQSLEKELASASKEWQNAADQLTEQRQTAAGKLAAATENRLHKLGMNQASFGIEVKARQRAEPGEHGQDQIAFVFSANPGRPAHSLHKIASGGELSRVSLALMLSARLQSDVPARVFDEVDAGIGGETAHVVGAFLLEVADGGQAFCVTHLAQVAARADHHYRVIKIQGQTATSIKVEALSRPEREEELARMLGNRHSAGSLAHAREMLESGAMKSQ
jgi:DNA repair protein RecN (Recombination protein N)